MSPAAFHSLTQWIVEASRTDHIQSMDAVGSTRLYPLSEKVLDSIGIDFSSDKAALFFGAQEWAWVRWFERYSFDLDSRLVNLFFFSPFVHEGVSYDVSLSLPVAALPIEMLEKHRPLYLARIGGKDRVRPVAAPTKVIPPVLKQRVGADSGVLLIDHQSVDS